MTWPAIRPPSFTPVTTLLRSVVLSIKHGYWLILVNKAYSELASSFYFISMADLT